MGTTTNNGWTYPESTDLVKDGATAIETLATDIDTTLGVYAPSTSGLELINTTSFSAVASQSVNSVFSSTYDNYKIFVVITGSSADDNTLNMRLRASGTDTITNYNGQRMYVAGSFVQDINGSGTDEWNISLIDKDQAYQTGVEINLYSPNLAQTTAMHTFNVGAAAGASYIMGTSGRQASSTVFDGFTLLALSGTMSGVISTFGLAK